MEYHYKCIKQHLYHPDIGNYISYGITLSEDPSVKVDDVHCERTFVENLVFLLNRYQAEPVHLIDIIDDFLSY